MSWISSVRVIVMSANRPRKGRPRRPEGIKRLKLRESTYNLWNERKEALGAHGLTNTEFAEMLLHQNFFSGQGDLRDHDRSGVTTTPSHGKMYSIINTIDVRNSFGSVFLQVILPL